MYCIPLSFHKLLDYKHITNPFRSDSILSLSTRQKITSVALASIGVFGAASLEFGAISACGMGILTNHVFTAICKGYNLSFYPNKNGAVVLALECASILTQENFNAVINHREPNPLSSSLCFLREANILTQENFNAVINYRDPSLLYAFLCCLECASILTQENFNVVINHREPDLLFSSLCFLREANILTQPRFELYLEFCPLMDNDLRRIPLHLFTTQVFDELIRRCREPNPAQQIRAYVDQLIGADQFGRGGVINNRQSTHTASIHKSASDSATRLYERYRGQLQGSNVLGQIEKYDFTSVDKKRGGFANSCVKNILRSEYTDPASKISLPNLLALCWIALHDDAQRKGALKDSISMLVEGLFEAEREYNLDENGRDLGGESRPACLSGAFNKILEKLSGLHPDVNIIFITKTTASLRLPCVVQEELDTYLKQNNLSSLADGISDEMWTQIRPKVFELMKDDYRSVFGPDEEFEAFIDAGQDL